MGYIPSSWGQVKMTFVPEPGKINCTQAKVYCPISLLSMQKMMQKLVARNMKEDTVGYVPYI